MKYDKIVKGDLVINSKANLKINEVFEIKGDLILETAINLKMPNLTSCGGWVRANEGAKISLPNVTSIGGWVEAWENAKISLKKDCKINDKNCPAFKTREFCLIFNFECFLKLGFLFADDILAKIIEKKRNVYKIQIAGKTETSYCLMVENGDDELPTFSHGKTIKEARESLIYKISNRDTSVYKNYKLDTVVSFEEAIRMYRTITGACEFGTKNFVQSLSKTKKKYKISEIIKITENQFGNETFREFFIK